MRNRRLWPLALEGLASLAWAAAIATSYVILAVVVLFTAADFPSGEAVVLGFSWGVAISVVATIQLGFALGVDFPYDRRAALTFLLAPLYPIAYWMITAAAALRAELPALLRPTAERRVVWDVPREHIPRP